MAATPLHTYKDLVDHLVDWLGANPSGEAHRDARRAVINGTRDLATAAQWSYYYRVGRINLVEPYSTGTVGYDHTGGAYERVVTLSSGTFPDWAAYGTIEINSIPYEVASRKSSTEITLSVNSNPGSDVASGTSYTLYRDSYPLPGDFKASGQVILVGHTVDLEYDHSQTMLERRKIYRGPAMPKSYSIYGDSNFMNTMQMQFYPPPDNVYQVEFLYQRRPRMLNLEDYHTGTASVTASSATVTGSGTEWASRMVGSVFRISRVARTLPTAVWGSNPAACNRIVVAVNSATSITLDDTVSETLSNMPYLLSDPVDVEDGAMLTALLRSCEYQLGHARNTRDRAMLSDAYKQALILARETDSRNFRDEWAGQRRPWPYRLADFPYSAS